MSKLPARPSLASLRKQAKSLLTGRRIRARALAEILLDAGADPNDSQGLYNCHFSPSNEWLKLLLSHGLTADAPVNADNPSEESTLNFLLAQAVRAGLVNRVRLLLEHGADALGRDNRYTHRTYVSNAVLSGHGDVLDLLVAHGAPRPDLSMKDRFRMAIVRGDAGEAKRLLSEHAGLSRQPGLLVQLAQTNRLDAVRLLLDLGADPNAMAMNGRGALHEAAWAGHREMIEILMDRGRAFGRAKRGARRHACRIRASCGTFGAERLSSGTLAGRVRSRGIRLDGKVGVRSGGGASAGRADQE
jgi:ankyrin repeat protein